MTDAKLERAPLDLAIKKAGGLRALARSLGITHRAIRQWDYVPAKYIIEIERPAYRAMCFAPIFIRAGHLSTPSANPSEIEE
jgi:hypothetical protein